MYLTSQALAVPLLALAHAAPVLAAPAFRLPAIAEVMGPAFVISTALIGFLCCYWAAWSTARFGNYRITADNHEKEGKSAAYFFDALLKAFGSAVVILDTSKSAPISYGAGGILLDAALAGSDAPVLAAAMDRLLKHSERFSLCVQTQDNGPLTVRASAIMGRSVIFLEKSDDSSKAVDYRATLDFLPVPVWVRDANLKLLWVNRAFAAAVGATTPQQALSRNSSLGRFEHDLAVAARDGAEIVDARRYTLVHGQRRSLNISLSRLPDMTVAGFAMDISEFSVAEAKLQIEADANADMLDGISIAIAVFGVDQRLASYNSGYASLLHLSADWLDTKPSLTEILDRLREERRLPEQRDFAEWRQEQVDLFENGGSHSERLWHLPDGQSLRMVAKPHLQGGVFFTFEDVSEWFRLRASLGTMRAVQKATLEAMEDGVAIFGPGGQLLANNAIFAKSWRFSDAELSEEPHFSKLAALSTARLGRDGVWDLIASAVTSTTPERYNEWGKIVRADGRTMSLTLTRLPDGATFIAFSDITDIERFDTVLHEAAHDAA